MADLKHGSAYYSNVLLNASYELIKRFAVYASQPSLPLVAQDGPCSEKGGDLEQMNSNLSRIAGTIGQ